MSTRSLVLAKQARRFNRAAMSRMDRRPGGGPHPGGHLPACLFPTDAARTPDPAACLPGLPTGTAVIVRARTRAERRALLIRLLPVARQLRLPLLVAEDWRLALRFRIGLHLPEALLHQSKTRVLLQRLGPRLTWITASGHGRKAIRTANALPRLDALLLSPVFPTASHPNAAFLGPRGLHRLATISRHPVYALGGVEAHTAPALTACGIAGVAAIGGLLE